MIARPKLVAVFPGPAPGVDPAVVGEWHLWEPADRPERFLVCFPPDWEAATTWLTARGAACLPHPDEPDGTPPAAAAVLGKLAGVRPGDGHVHGLRKVMNAVGWRHLDPLR